MIGATTARALSQVTSRPKVSTTAPSDSITPASLFADTSRPVRVRMAVTTSPTTGAPVPRLQKISIRRRTPKTLASTRVSSASARAAIGRSENSLSR